MGKQVPTKKGKERKGREGKGEERRGKEGQRWANRFVYVETEQGHGEKRKTNKGERIAPAPSDHAADLHIYYIYIKDI